MTAARNITVALAAVAAAGAAAFAYGSLWERRQFTLRRATVPVLPSGAAPIRVLHLSDLHMAPWQKAKQEWVRALAGEHPDFIVDTGDNLGHPDAIEAVAYALEPFDGIPGVFVNGSNDYFGPTPKNPLKYFTGPSKTSRAAATLDIERLQGVFAQLGWTNLNNAAAAIDVRGTRLELFGVDDPHRHFDRLEVLTTAIDELHENDPLLVEGDTWPDSATSAQDAADSRRSTLTVGVAHAPYQRVLNSFLNHGAELIFAGHTHGGQVCLPGYGALVTNCDIPRRQAKGLSLWRHGLRSAFLNVSAGLGTSIYAPVRFACRPEASLLTLVAADA
ncbi:metallophosphoesterase [Compostimonas suwonensis]|uniref:Putative MPP superfamily phosphohydrolase n=1 Tax=Compostimonas suwonensis TaxID=1048394 RepID=A0A2M9BC40_9MICO|nr:metallophosphoesterase [Compostimonas suwonensis]PJJ55525.1 putative MPP superfamily phosphohydrolase [Compostimonas suwonensis]